jgi:hypothetical protein
MARNNVEVLVKTITNTPRTKLDILAVGRVNAEGDFAPSRFKIRRWRQQDNAVTVETIGIRFTALNHFISAFHDILANAKGNDWNTEQTVLPANPNPFPIARNVRESTGERRAA